MSVPSPLSLPASGSFVALLHLVIIIVYVQWVPELRRYRIFQRLMHIDVKMMKESGCAGVYLGIESASDKVLKNMNKRVTSKQLPLGLCEMPADFINAYVLGSLGATGATIGACATFLYNLRQGVEDIQSGRRRVVMVGGRKGRYPQ